MMLLSFLVLVGKVLNTDQTKPTKPGKDPDPFPFLTGKVLTYFQDIIDYSTERAFPFLIGKVLTHYSQRQVFFSVSSFHSL